MADRTAHATRNIDVELDAIRQTVADVVTRCAQLSTIMEKMRTDSGIVSNAAARKAFVRDEVRNEVETLIDMSVSVGVHSQDVATAAAQLLGEANILHAQLKDHSFNESEVL